MKSLVCVVIGDGSVFVVKIDERENVGILKKMIKEEKPSIIKCEADRLTLYVATKAENWITSDKDWLPSRDPDVKLLKQKQTPKEISAIMTESREMDPADEIGDVFASAPTKKVIHVIVKLPDVELQGGVAPAGGDSKRQKLEPVPRSQWFALDFEQVVAPLPSSPFYTPRFDAITMEEWLEMTYNGNVLNLQMEDEQLSVEETRKLAGFKCFTMEFPVLIRNTESARNRVFVRPCYEILFGLLLENIENSRPSVAITGNPGIGKSQFYAYCAFRLSKEPLNGKTLIVNFDDRYFAFVNGNFHDLSIDQVNLYQFNRDVVRLIDGRSNKLLGWRGVSILFTSPGCPDYREFLKASFVEYVMPPWTVKELSIAASVVEVPVAEVQRRSLHFGGIARYVFAPDPSELESQITQSMSKVESLTLFDAVSSREEDSEKNYSHRLLLMYPQHTNRALYREFYLDFTSEEIANRVYDRLVEKSYSKLTKFIVANAEDSNSGGFRGILFEIFCHRMWSNRGPAQLRGRALAQDEDSEEDEELLIDVPDTIEPLRFAKLTQLPEFKEGTKFYCRPVGKTYPCIDAIYWTGKTCFLLQMTISDRHGIAHAPLIKILDWCADKWPIAFVFVVPDGKVKLYQRQNLLTSAGTVYQKPNIKARALKQYVVGVKVTPR